MCKVCERKAKVRKTILRRMNEGLTTAEEIAREVGVSVRTVYRYVGELRQEGHPIAGGSGIGYMMRPLAPAKERRANG